MTQLLDDQSIDIAIKRNIKEKIRKESFKAYLEDYKYFFTFCFLISSYKSNLAK